MMAFSPEFTYIEKLLNDKVIYTIPKYQRKYVWDKVNIIQLLDDIDDSSATEDESHFLGNLVLTKEKDSEYKIIDGQQRMTTLEIIIFVLIYLNAVEYLNNDNKQIINNIEYLSDFISTKKGLNGIKQKLEIFDQAYKNICEFCITIADNDSEEKLSDYIKKTIENIDLLEEKELHNRNAYITAFNIIKDYLSTKNTNNLYEYITTFQTKLLKTRIVKMDCFDELEAYTIFEILNARGERLKQIELLKSYIFKNYKEGKTIDKVKQKWENIENNLDGIDTDVFLMHFLRSYYGSKVNKNSTYDYIKKHENKNNLKSFFSSLVEYSKVYNSIVNADANNKYEKMALNYFKIKGNQQLRPLLTSLKIKINANIIEQNQYNKLLEYLLKYFIGYNLISGYSNKIDDKIINATNKIYSSTNQHEIECEIYSLLLKSYEYYPTKAEIKEKLISIKYSNKYKKGNINSELLLFLFDMILAIDKNNQEYNIEHIIPDSKQDEKVWRLGNLIPTPKQFNTKLKDKDFQFKRALFCRSGIPHLIDFGQKMETFTEENIEKRTKILVDDIAEKIFLDKQEDLSILWSQCQAILNVTKRLGDIAEYEKISHKSREAVFKNLTNDNVTTKSINDEIKREHEELLKHGEFM